MSLATQIIDQQVSRIVSQLDDAFTNELRIGSSKAKRRTIGFLFLVSKTMFELNDENTLDGIVDGGEDYGIDALYFNPPDQGEIKIALIQGKYKNDLRGNSAFPETAVTRMISAIGDLFDPGQSVAVNDRLRRRIEELRSFVAEGAIPRVTAIAANNGLMWASHAQNRIDKAAESFGDQVDWQHVGSEGLLAMLQAQQPIDAEFYLTGRSLVETFEFRRVLMGRMSVSQLARLTRKYGTRLFERNIRRYLGSGGRRVNEAVARTLRESDQRPNFYFYNNGITMTCSQFRHNSGARSELARASQRIANCQWRTNG